MNIRITYAKSFIELYPFRSFSFKYLRINCNISSTVKDNKRNEKASMKNFPSSVNGSHYVGEI